MRAKTSVDGTRAQAYGKAVVLAVASAGLGAAALEPGSWAGVGLVAFAPLVFALRACSPKLALALGWATGAAMAAAGYRFLPGALVAGGVDGWRAGALYVGLALLRGANVGLGALVGALVQARGGRGTLATAVAIAVFEAALAVPLAFPFGGTLLGSVELVQIADVFGASSLTLVAAMSAAGIAETAAWLGSRRVERATIAISAGALAGAWLYGASRARELDSALRDAPSWSAELVQPAHRRGAPAPLLPLLGREPVDIAVFPEASLPRGLPRSDLDPLAAALFSGVRAPVVVGATEASDRGSKNVALVVEGGRSSGRYEKHELIPLAEADYVVGTDQPPVKIGAVPVAMTICYEDTLPGFVRDQVRRSDALAIVDLANDGWFAGTNEPELHLAVARLRAIELRRSVLRAANDGVTAAIDPLGRVVARAPRDVATTLTASVPLVRTTSIYEEFGMVPFGALSAALFIFAAAFRRKGSDLAPPNTAADTAAPRS